MIMGFRLQLLRIIYCVHVNNGAPKLKLVDKGFHFS